MPKRIIASPDRRAKGKGRKTSGTFLLLPHDCIDHNNFVSLSPRAVKLLIDVARQYNGSNNGDLTACWSIMSKRGWTSKDQLGKAIRELLQRGWLVLTRQGRRPKVASLYALTWKPIDECGGKLDRAPTKQALSYWRLGTNPELAKTECDPRHTGQSAPPHGAMESKGKRHSPAVRVSRGRKHAIH